MALFVLICHDAPQTAEARQQHRPAHLERLAALDAAGQLRLAGPTPVAHGLSEITGSVIVADFADEAAAQDWVAQEPFLLHGVYSHVDIKPFVQVFPKA